VLSSQRAGLSSPRGGRTHTLVASPERCLLVPRLQRYHPNYPTALRAADEKGQKVHPRNGFWEMGLERPVDAGAVCCPRRISHTPPCDKPTDWGKLRWHRYRGRGQKRWIRRQAQIGACAETVGNATIATHVSSTCTRHDTGCAHRMDPPRARLPAASYSTPRRAVRAQSGRCVGGIMIRGPAWKLVKCPLYSCECCGVLLVEC
jgi:hypothetical protein